MYKTILEEHREKQLGDVNFTYFGPEDVRTKFMSHVRWKAVEDAAAAMPQGKCMVADVPEGMPIARYQYLVRQAFGMAKATGMSKWSVRQHVNGKQIVILKVLELSHERLI